MCIICRACVGWKWEQPLNYRLYCRWVIVAQTRPPPWPYHLSVGCWNCPFLCAELHHPCVSVFYDLLSEFSCRTMLKKHNCSLATRDDWKHIGGEKMPYGGNILPGTIDCTILETDTLDLNAHTDRVITCCINSIEKCLLWFLPPLAAVHSKQWVCTPWANFISRPL